MKRRPFALLTFSAPPAPPPLTGRIQAVAQRDPAALRSLEQMADAYLRVDHLALAHQDVTVILNAVATLTHQGGTISLAAIAGFAQAMLDADPDGTP